MGYGVHGLWNARYGVHVHGVWLARACASVHSIRRARARAVWMLGRMDAVHNGTCTYAVHPYRMHKRTPSMHVHVPSHAVHDVHAVRTPCTAYPSGAGGAAPLI